MPNALWPGDLHMHFIVLMIVSTCYGNLETIVTGNQMINYCSWLAMDNSTHGPASDMRLVNQVAVNKDPRNATKIEYAGQGFQNGLFTFHIPKDERELKKILLSIKEKMKHDENEVSNLPEREMHFLCPFPSTDIADKLQRKNLQEFIQQVGIPINQEVYFLEFKAIECDKLEESKMIFIWETYNIGDITKFSLVQKLGGANFIDTMSLLSYSSRRGNLMGIALKVVGQRDEKYEAAFHSEVHNGSAIFKSGEQLKMLWDYRHMLNFTYVPVKGKGWPLKLIRNGTRLDGFAEQIMDGDADISASSAAWNAMRAERLHFLPPTDYSEEWIFYRRKTTFGSTKSLLLLPFSWELWITSAASLVIVQLAIIFIVAVKRRILDQSGELKLPIMDFIVYISGLQSCQGGGFDPRATSLRVATVTVAMTSSMLYMAYSGSFVAAASKPLTLIQSYAELVEHGFTVFTDPDFPGHCESFVKDPNQVRQLLQISRNIYNGSADMVTKVLDQRQKYAVIYRSDGFYAAAIKQKLSLRRICDAAAVKPKRKTRVLESLVMRKGSPMRELFTQKTVLLLERGLMRLYFKRVHRKTQVPCRNPVSAQVLIMTVSECMLAFYILGMGLILAPAALLFEYMLGFRNNLTSFSRRIISILKKPTSVSIWRQIYKGQAWEGALYPRKIFLP